MGNEMQAYCEARDAFGDVPQTDRERVLWDRLCETLSELYDAREEIDDRVTQHDHDEAIEEIEVERDEEKERADKAEQALVDLKADIARDAPESVAALLQENARLQQVVINWQNRGNAQVLEITRLKREALEHASTHVHKSALTALETRLWCAFDAAIDAMRMRRAVKPKDAGLWIGDLNELRAYASRYDRPEWGLLANDAEYGKRVDDAKKALTKARAMHTRERG